MTSHNDEEDKGVNKQFTDDVLTPVGDARAYVGQLPDAALLFRADGFILAANDEAAELLGMSTDELCTRRLDEVFIVEGDDAQTPFEAFVERSILPLKRKRQNVFPSRSSSIGVEARTMSVPHAGTQTVYISMVSDSAEGAWREPSRMDIRSSQSERDEVRKMRNRFVEMLSHEFRTPLTVIRSSSDLLLRYSAQLTEEQRERYLHIIQEQVHVLSRLIHDALSVSEQGASMHAERRAIELQSFIDSLLRQCKDIPREHSTVRIINDWPHATVDADEHLLRLALCNILSNAVRYSPADREVNLRFHGDGDDLVITVTDHGRGIPDDDLADVFDAFFRASNVDDVHGVGLGLTLARDFIQSHGGILAIQSREGEGTTAIVRLPQR